MVNDNDKETLKFEPDKNAKTASKEGEDTAETKGLGKDKPKISYWGKLQSLQSGTPDFFLTDKTKRYSVGRNSDTDLSIKKPVVSGKHCEIWFSEGTAFIEDTSTNGTFLNEAKIGKRKKKILTSGSKITIAKAHKKLNIDEISFLYIDGTEETGEGIHVDYLLKQTLGSGAFATVRLGVHKKNLTQHAIKIICKKKFAKTEGGAKLQDLENEVEILKQIQHPNIVGIETYYNTEENLYLVLELVKGGELLDYINEKQLVDEDEARPLVKQMLEAIEYLHSKGIAHRDLKFENILLKDEKKDVIKISDFGLSRIIGEGNFMNTICGTPEYLAPEVLTDAKKTGYSKAVDMWSMGVIFYTLLTGLRPFEQTTTKSLFDVVKEGIYTYPDDVTLSDLAMDLIGKMLTKDPKKRITATEALQHPWILKGEPEKLEAPQTPPLGELAPPTGKKRLRDFAPEDEAELKKQKLI